MQPTNQLYLSTNDLEKANKLAQEILKTLRLNASYTKPAIVLHAMSQVVAVTHITISRKIPEINTIMSITDTAINIIKGDTH